MPPPSESPFKRDEPVGRSSKWMWLAGIAAAVWTATCAFDMFREFEVEMETLWRIVGVGLRLALVILLFRALRAASRCRQRRSFDLMAVAVRSQRPFWALLCVAGAAGCVALTVHTFRMVDINRALTSEIAQREAFRRWAEQNPEAFKRMMEQNAYRASSPQR